MRLNSKTSWLSVAGLGALLLTGPAVAPARAGITIRFGRGENRLDDQRLNTMRRLAHHLDQAAQTAAHTAGDTAQERNGQMRQRFLWAINDFARQTRSFNERLDNYGNSPWDVADEVAALDQRARDVSRQIRSANAFPDTYEDWAEAVNALNLMHRSLGGQDVAIPSAGRRPYQPFDDDVRHADSRPDPGPGGSDSRDGYVTGTSRREFRRLANSLSVEMERATSLADRRPAQSDRDNQAIAEFHDFAQRVSDLNQSADAGFVNSREIGPIVGHLLDDAHQNDRSSRERNAYPRVDWTASIGLL